jgi:hypothetical protein
MAKIIPNGRKMFQMVIKYNIIIHTFQSPPKFTNIWIFGLKINHLATLLCTQIVRWLLEAFL